MTIAGDQSKLVISILMPQVKAMPLKTTYWNNLRIFWQYLSVALVLARISRLRTRIILRIRKEIIQYWMTKLTSVQLLILCKLHFYNYVGSITHDRMNELRTKTQKNRRNEESFLKCRTYCINELKAKTSQNTIAWPYISCIEESQFYFPG